MKICALIVSLALVLGFTAIGCGGGTAAPIPPPPAADGTVEGTATNAGPVDGATVMLTPTAGGTTYTDTTDASGDYSIDVPAGTYDLLAYKDVMYDDYTAVVTVTSAATTTEDIAFVAAATYVGHTVCMACHNTAVGGGQDDIHSDWLTTGHRFKITQVTGGVAPSYPYTTLPNLPTLFDDTTADEGLATDPDGVAGTTDNPNGTPADWSAISYVIGGFGWKARCMDADGYIVTGTEVQYNFWDGSIFDWNGGGGSMSKYHNNEGYLVPPTSDDKGPKFYNCGNCHTTGWRHQDATLHDMRQGGLAGIDGTWAATGIECEACHGAGSRHAAAPSTTNIVRDALPRTTAQLQAHGAGYGLPVHCAECHTRDGERDYPTYMSAANNAGWTGDPNWLGGAPVGGRIAVSGEFIRHHEQYDELLGIDPDTMTSTRSAAFAGAHGDCYSCHDAHRTTHHAGNPLNPGFPAPSGPGWRQDCTVCHTGAQYTNITHLTDPDPDRPDHCIDCHMPLLSKSALATFDAIGLRPSEGDVRSHIFTIDLSRDPANQFTSDGKFAYPEITGRHACHKCHDSTNGVAFSITFPNGMTIHPTP